jgi:hypothetical protein
MSTSCRCGLQEWQEQGHLQLQHRSSSANAASAFLLLGGTAESFGRMLPTSRCIAAVHWPAFLCMLACKQVCKQHSIISAAMPLPMVAAGLVP